MTTDRVEKTIVLSASLSRVWRAIARAEEFGSWFGCKLAGEFAPGAQLTGQVTTPGYEHMTMRVLVERVDPEHLLSFRWYPAQASEATTLVEFRLAAEEGGTRLTVVESGFDGLPADRREAALRDNEKGWAHQMENITRYVSA
jgi:uncharacterized protein YndB with AHSA1/START domain